MNNTLQAAEVEYAIRYRRTIKPEKMNGRVIPDETILEILSLADWAPTHGRTEPWRFIVIGTSAVQKFTSRHGDLYRQHTHPEKFVIEKYNNLVNLGINTSHIIIAYMKRSPTHKVPAIEEVAATAAAIQNLLLAATTRGIATFWNSGGLTHHPAFKEEYHLGEEDVVLGIIYLGYSDEPFKEGIRMTPLAQKVEWIR